MSSRLTIRGLAFDDLSDGSGALLISLHAFYGDSIVSFFTAVLHTLDIVMLFRSITNFAVYILTIGL